MPNSVVVGTQWGDEGKAKVIDYLAEKCDVVIRFHGGANAGHTVIVNGEKFVFHLVPSGISYPDKTCVIGNGVVVDPEQLFFEIDELAARGIKVEGRLFVSDLAHIVLPLHKMQDSISENTMSKGKIGTTGRGIGPAYSDKMLRVGIRVFDLLDWNIFSAKLQLLYDFKKKLFENVYQQPMQITMEEILEKYRLIQKRIVPLMADTSRYLYDASQNGKSLLFEGAQGTFLDIDHGTYPFVTSSNTIAGSACTGAGMGPAKIDHVIGITKAYTTRVGNGPFPTEDAGEAGENIRTKGLEFGATTGRPRRCGWFDSVMLRKSVELNGVTRIALTKLDVLDGLDDIKVCTHYEIGGKKIEHFPNHIEILDKVKPVYEMLPGWKCSLTGVKKLADFPSNAIKYVKRIQSLCHNVPMLMVSIGPDRTETIEVTPL